MQRIINFFTEHRLIDGQIGVLGFVIWFKFFAGYGSWFHIASINIKHLGGFDLAYHSKPRGYYPAVTFYLMIGKIYVINTGKKAEILTSESVKRWQLERRSADERDAEILRAAKKSLGISE